jgi:hypothetical protein
MERQTSHRLSSSSFWQPFVVGDTSSSITNNMLGSLIAKSAKAHVVHELSYTLSL